MKKFITRVIKILLVIVALDLLFKIIMAILSLLIYNI